MIFTAKDFELQASILSKILFNLKRNDNDSLVDWKFEASKSTKPCQLVHPTILSECSEAGRQAESEFDVSHDNSILNDEDLILQQVPLKIEWRFSVVYSDSWRIPTLWFTAQDPSGTSLPREKLLSILPSPGIQDSWDFISHDEHPVTGAPSYFLHPCQTSNRLKQLLKEEKLKLPLLSWLSMILPAVGFKLSSNTFRQVQKQLIMDFKSNFLNYLTKDDEEKRT